MSFLYDIPERIICDLDAEQSFLRTCMAAGSGEALFLLSEEDFVRPLWRKFHQALCMLQGAGITLSVSNLRIALGEMGLMNEIHEDWGQGLTELWMDREGCVEDLVLILRRKTQLRKLAEIGNRLAHAAHEDDGDTEFLVRNMRWELARLSFLEDMPILALDGRGLGCPN